MSNEALHQQDNPVETGGEGRETVETSTNPNDSLILGKFKNVDDLAESYKHLEKKLGERPQGLVPPGEDASDEDKAAFQAEVRKLSGVPDAPDGYGMEPPEGEDAEAFNGFLAWAYEAGLSKPQVEAIAARVADERKQAEEAMKQQAEAWDGELKKAWGDSYKANLEQTDRALALMDPDGKLAERLGDHKGDPVIRQALLEASKWIPENKLKGGETRPDLSSLPSKAEVRKRFSDPRYNDPSKRDRDFVRETDEMWDALHGESTYRGGPVTVSL